MPIPSQMIKSGKNATVGDEYFAMMNGSSVSRAKCERPIRVPIGTPTTTDNRKPQPTTSNEAFIWTQIEPSANTS